MRTLMSCAALIRNRCRGRHPRQRKIPMQMIIKNGAFLPTRNASLVKTAALPSNKWNRQHETGQHCL